MFLITEFFLERLSSYLCLHLSLRSLSELFAERLNRTIPSIKNYSIFVTENTNDTTDRERTGVD